MSIEESRPPEPPSGRRVPKLHPGVAQTSSDFDDPLSDSFWVGSEENVMSIEQAVVEKLRTLPADKQQEVLDFTEFLQLRAAGKRPLRSPARLCSLAQSCSLTRTWGIAR